MKYFIMLMSIWSCKLAHAEPAGLVTLDSSYRDVGQTLKIENLPSVRSQDSIPACGGFSAAAVSQFYICKVKQISNCSGLSPKDVVSPLSAIAWMHTNTGYGVPETQNHRNIQIYHQYSSATGALKNAAGDFIFSGDSCYPMDQLANKEGFFKQDKVKGLFDSLEREYNKYITEGNICEDCMKGAASELNISTPIEELKAALKTEKEKGKNGTFGQFLYKVILSKCRDVVGGRIRPKPTFGMFPDDGDEFSYDAVMGKIKDVLSKGYPLTAGGICIDKSKNGECKSTHSLVITGYRKVCKIPQKKENCRDVVKVLNSWGADWQKNNDDGWVDAEELLSNQVKNKSIMKNMLAWYTTGT